MKRIAVIGGGISGLAAAFALQKQKEAGAPIEYVLFESSGRFGGVIKTERVEGCVLESGPDSFLSEKPWASDLCRELGLEDQLIGSNDTERKTYILRGNRLIALPDGLMFMVPTKLGPTFFSPLFSWKTKLRILREWFYKPTANAPDTTIADFVARHYGREMVERVADPLLAGIYGGCADELSLHAVLPRFADMESKFGSLSKAMLAARNARPALTKPLFTSPQNGMQQIADALVGSMPALSHRLNTPVADVAPESGKWLIKSGGRTEEFDAAILATPAYAAAELMQSSDDLTRELRGIRYNSSVAVALIYDGSVRASLPPGFGFLVPRTEGCRLIAATFVHNKFPHRAPPNRAVVRCFIGGSKNEEVFSKHDKAMVDIVRSELRKILKLHAEPLAVRISRWPRVIAQYEMGHTARVERIRSFVDTADGLGLAGNAYSGIGVPDCVRSGTEAAHKVLRDLRIVTLI